MKKKPRFSEQILPVPWPFIRLQNSPYFCVFKYAQAVKQKVWNKAENRERDWGETPVARVRLLRHALPISLLILRKKRTVLQSTLHYLKVPLHCIEERPSLPGPFYACVVLNPPPPIPSYITLV